MYNIGIDLGGTNIAAAIVSQEGKMIRKASVPTKKERDYPAIVKDMADLTLRLIEEEGLKKEEIHSVGIGSPGTCDIKNGVIEYANNLYFKNTPIREEFNKYFPVDVYVGNDANVAAYGEYISGAGDHYNDLVMITLGTGVGGGVILDGQIIEGSYHGGAELGHTVIAVDGEACTCGRQGCWEAYSSATALIRDAKRAGEANPDSLLNDLVKNDLSQMNAKIPFDAAQAGDLVAQEVIGSYIKHLAIGLVNIVNIFQPEVIVLGGGVSAQKDKLITPLVDAMIHDIYGGKEALKTELKVAQLGNDAGIIGAAMLHHLFDD